MKISLVTPSLNQGKFIEETINSVLNQKGDFELEYFVIDGGSTDDTLEILKKYEKSHGLKWISEKDSGQSEAINKGFKMATGDVINWLCSDDLLESGALQKIAEFFTKNKDAKVVFGQNLFINESGEVFKFFKSRKFCREELIKRWNKVYIKFNLPQPSVFLKKDLLDEIGFINEKLPFAMDYEWYLRINKKYEFYFLDEIISRSRFHKDCKSIKLTKDQYKESIMVSRSYIKENYFRYLPSYLLHLPYIKALEISIYLRKNSQIFNKFMDFVKGK